MVLKKLSIIKYNNNIMQWILIIPFSVSRSTLIMFLYVNSQTDHEKAISQIIVNQEIKRTLYMISLSVQNMSKSDLSDNELLDVINFPIEDDAHFVHIEESLKDSILKKK